MATSQLVTDYLSYGTHAARPVSPNTGTGVAPVYYETDTLHFFAWSGSAWVQIDGGGGTAALTRIAETILGADTASITFSSIPASYRNLFLTITARTDQASVPNPLIQLNGDTGSTYHWQYAKTNTGNTTYGGSTALVTSFQYAAFGMVTGATANAAVSAQLRIFDYARTAWFKNFIAESTYFDGTNTNIYSTVAMGNWENTAAVNSVKIFLSAGNYKASTVCTLWGEV